MTFEVDANAILSVSALEKGTGKAEKIVITNDKGRLTQEEIERMIKDAEEFAEEDKMAKEKIDARNQLDNYLFSMKNTIEDPEKLADKLSEEEKSTIKSALDEAEQWLNSNQDASKEEYEEQKKTLEDICNPIISKAYKESPPEGEGAAEDEDYDATTEL